LPLAGKPDPQGRPRQARRSKSWAGRLTTQALLEYIAQEGSFRQELTSNLNEAPWNGSKSNSKRSCCASKTQQKFYGLDYRASSCPGNQGDAILWARVPAEFAYGIDDECSLARANINDRIAYTKSNG